MRAVFIFLFFFLYMVAFTWAWLGSTSIYNVVSLHASLTTLSREKSDKCQCAEELGQRLVKGFQNSNIPKICRRDDFDCYSILIKLVMLEL